MTVRDIINALSDDARKHADRFGLRKAVLKFGQEENGITFIQTSLGNVAVSDKNLTHNRIHGDPKEGVYLLRAGRWQLIVDSLRINI